MALAGLRPLARPAIVLAIPWPMVVGLLYCAFSLTWAIDPEIGARRLFLTFLVMWTAFATVRNLGYDRALAVLRWMLGAAVFVNIAVAVLAPQYGIHQANDVLDKNLIGDWRGFMVQKNHTAAATAFAILAFAFGGGRLPWAIRLPVLLAASFLLYKTGSRTSLGLCIGVVAIGLFFLLYRARYRFALLVAMIVGLMAAGNLIGFLRIDRLLTANSSRELLSGRTDIWDAVFRYAKDSDYLGAGYGSFWEIGGRSPIFRYGNSWVVQLSQGHNGYLDLLATVGAVGLVVIVILSLAWPIARLLSSRGAEGHKGAMVLAMLVFVAGHNGTETSLFDRDSLPQVMLAIALGLLGLVVEGWHVHPRARTGGRAFPGAGMNPAERLIAALRDPRISGEGTQANRKGAGKDPAVKPPISLDQEC